MVQRLLIILCMCLATAAFAQTRPDETPERSPRDVPPQALSTRDAATPAPPPNNSAAAAAGLRMRSNGGSLLRATLAAAPDPAQAPLDAVSFFAVPPPEPKVIRKNDLVTIIVREESEYSSDATTETKKEASLNAQVAQFIKLNLPEFTLSGDAISDPLVIDASGNREFKGEGNVERTDRFVTRIQAEVLDVKPNGILVLQARKEIVTDDEFARMTLTGTCRAEDLTPDNTVLSTQLYDLSLRKQHKGNVRNATKKGVLPRIVDFINPF